MGMEQLRVCERRQHDAVVLAVSGELDVATGPQLDRRLAALAAAGDHHVVLDAADLVFCDASGITALLRGHIRACEQQGWLRLAAVHARVRRVLVITALTRELQVFDTVADAVADVSANSSPGVTSAHQAALLP
jgi:anti-sigma B factor antagonist